MTFVELRGEEITDVPRRSSQLNTQLKHLRKESLEKKKTGLPGFKPWPCLSPSRFSFRAAESLTFRTTREKKIPLATQANEPLLL